jgi:hypothetical protein
MPYERSCDYDTGDQHLKSFVTLIIAPRLAWNSVLTLLMPPPLRFGRRPHDRQYAPCYTYSHKNLEGKAQTLQTLRSDPVITRYHSLGLLPDVYLYTSKVEGLLRFNTCISAYKWDQEFRIRESPRAVITLIMQEPGTDDQLIIIKAEDDRDLQTRSEVSLICPDMRLFRLCRNSSVRRRPSPKFYLTWRKVFTHRAVIPCTAHSNFRLNQPLSMHHAPSRRCQSACGLAGDL